MAVIEIKTTIQEQRKVLEALKRIGEVSVPVHKIATEAGLPESRARYALTDLIDKGIVDKVQTKAFNKHYVRYCYKVLKDL